MLAHEIRKLVLCRGHFLDALVIRRALRILEAVHAATLRVKGNRRAAAVPDSRCRKADAAIPGGQIGVDRDRVGAHYRCIGMLLYVGRCKLPNRVALWLVVALKRSVALGGVQRVFLASKILIALGLGFRRSATRECEENEHSRENLFHYLGSQELFTWTIETQCSGPGLRRTRVIPNNS